VRAPSETLLAEAEFRRLLGWSFAGHVGLAVVFSIGIGSRGPAVMPAPIMVDLIAAAPTPPAVKRPPKQTVDQPVVIPKRPKPVPKQAEKPAPKPKPEPAPKAEPVEEPAPSASEVLAQLRAKVGPDTDTAPAARGASGGRVDPELAAYRKQVMLLLRSNWAGGRLFATQPGLEARYEVRLDPGGGVRAVALVRSSGNRYYDESAERAIHKSQPFPGPPRGSLTLEVTFQPTSVF
jgi:TonB family protein